MARTGSTGRKKSLAPLNGIAYPAPHTPAFRRERCRCHHLLPRGTQDTYCASPPRGTALQEYNGPLRSDDPPRRIGFARQELSGRHRCLLKVTRRYSPLTTPRRYLSSGGEVKVKRTGDGRPGTGDRRRETGDGRLETGGLGSERRAPRGVKERRKGRGTGDRYRTTSGGGRSR